MGGGGSLQVLLLLIVLYMIYIDNIVLYIYTSYIIVETRDLRFKLSCSVPVGKLCCSNAVGNKTFVDHSGIVPEERQCPKRGV